MFFNVGIFPETFSSLNLYKLDRVEEEITSTFKKQFTNLQISFFLISVQTNYINPPGSLSNFLNIFALFFEIPQCNAPMTDFTINVLSLVYSFCFFVKFSDNFANTFSFFLVNSYDCYFFGVHLYVFALAYSFFVFPLLLYVLFSVQFSYFLALFLNLHF